MTTINNLGNISDIRTSLKFWDVTKNSNAYNYLIQVNKALDNERKYRNRKTVIIMLETKQRQLEKIFLKNQSNGKKHTARHGTPR